MAKPVAPQVIGDLVRKLRTRRHVSVRGFAVQTGFSPSFISQLENGLVSPSLGSLQKIADALGVSLGEFFATAAAASDEALVVRPADRRRLDSTWTDGHLEALGSMAPSRKLEPVLAIFGPGGKSGKHPHSHSHEEFAFVVKGRITLTLGDEQNELAPGDAVTLPAHAPRMWENRSKETAEILMVSSRARA
jgi:transcriptional regulator with XRE-family HTH domain